MDELRRLQLTELEILKWFHGFCRENDLTYYIVAGTLLGAVRHGGFIPWDDDIDVAMPRQDLLRFQELAKTQLPPELYYQCHDTEPGYVFGFSKLRKNGTQVWEEYLANVDIHKGAYIDIFPLDPCPQGFMGKLMFKAVELLSSAMMEASGMDFKCGYTKWYMRALYSLAVKQPLPRLSRLRDRVVEFFSKRADGSLQATVHGAHGFPRETYQAAWLGRGKSVLFENMAVMAPEEPHSALENMYGDYMTLPEDRSGHFNMEKTIV